MNSIAHYYLLQINDALFPIGAYSHSYGLETYIQKGLIKNASEASQYLKNKLCYAVLYSDLLGARLAYDYTLNNDFQKLIELNTLTTALKSPMELREASFKLGSRFIKTIEAIKLPLENTSYYAFTHQASTSKLHHCCLYGSFCAAMGISKEAMLTHYLYAQTSAIVTTCVKTIPLSQTEGQQILSESYSLLSELTRKVLTLDANWYGCSTPSFDIRSMQHECLYSRLYMS